MKKVLFTSHTANFSKFNRPYMRWFKEHGYEVHYASAGEEQVLDCDKHFDVCFNRSPYSLDNIKAYKQLKKIIDEENYELIHCHTPMGSVVTRLASKEARKRGTKVLYTAHGFHFYKGAPMFNWMFFYPVEKYLSKYTDCIITINEEDYQLGKNRFNKTQVEKINGVGVDLSRFKPVTEEEKLSLRKKYGFDKDDFILVYVAEFTKNKNHKFIVKNAMKLKQEIPRLKILFAGNGAVISETEAMSEKLGFKDTISFLGYRRDIDKIYKISDVGISASMREGLPFNIIEAMSVGLPIVCGKIRGQVDVVKDDINGFLFETNNDIQFNKPIIDLYKNENKRKTIGKNNINDVGNFSLENVIKNMGEIYGLFISE